VEVVHGNFNTPDGYQAIERTVEDQDASFDLCQPGSAQRYILCVRRRDNQSEYTRPILNIFGVASPRDAAAQSSSAPSFNPLSEGAASGTASDTAAAGNYALDAARAPWPYPGDAPLPPEAGLVAGITPAKIALKLYSHFASEAIEWSSYLDSEVLSQFPMEDQPDCPLPSALTMFCQPHGVLIRETPPSLRILSFVLTNSEGAQLYAVCLNFWDLVPYEAAASPPRDASLSSQTSTGKASRASNAAGNQSGALNSKATMSSSSLAPGNKAASSSVSSLNSISSVSSANLQKSSQRTYAIMRSLCILSRYPLYSVFSHFLVFLHQVIEKKDKVPLERYIKGLLESLLSFLSLSLF
jgi:hypothetical protein